MDNLFVDNVGGAKTATQYLVELGHRRIAMIAGAGGPEQVRIKGYLEALGEVGLQPRLVTHSEFNDATKEILARGARPSSIFAGIDLMALGAMSAIREAKLTIPQKIALMGFDDIFAARCVTPPLSTINQFANLAVRPDRTDSRDRCMVQPRGPASFSSGLLQPAC